MKTSIEYCFTKPQAIFVTQAAFNDKSAKMEQTGEKRSLGTKADSTLRIYAKHSGADGKLNDEVTRKRKKEEAIKLERENKAIRDQLAVSEGKRLKAEAKAKNSTGGPQGGAHQTKSTQPSSLSTPKPILKGGRNTTHQGGRGGRNTTGGRGQGRGDGRGRNPGRGRQDARSPPAAAAGGGLSTGAPNANDSSSHKRLRKKKRQQGQS